MPENPTLTTDLTGQGGKIVKVKSDESGYEFQSGGAGGGDLVAANNLSDVASASTARTNLGLGNVNNTSDANKPVSSATQTALNGKSDSSHDHDSDYAAIAHNHDSDYAQISHNHDSDYEPLKGADDNFVTDAEKTKLSNLSGTNTGDQDLSALALKATTITINGDSKDISANRSWTVTGTQPDIPLTKIAPASNQTITAGYGAYVPFMYELVNGISLEIGAGSYFEIG